MKKARHGRKGTIRADVPISDFGDGEVFSSNAQPPLPPTASLRRPERLDIDNANAVEHEVSELAYSFWQRRGCPEGSPEVDWFLAERAVRLRSTLR